MLRGDLTRRAVHHRGRAVRLRAGDGDSPQAEEAGGKDLPRVNEE